MQPRVFDEGMKRLVTVFGDVSADKTALYWDALKDLPDGGFVLAVKEAVKRCEFFPKPKHLREFAAPYRLPVIKPSYNSQQIEEFSEQTREQAKAALKRLQDGLENWQDEPVEVLIKPVTGADLSFKMKSKQVLNYYCKRKKELQDQARKLGVAA